MGVFGMQCEFLGCKMEFLGCNVGLGVQYKFLGCNMGFYGTEGLWSAAWGAACMHSPQHGVLGVQCEFLGYSVGDLGYSMGFWGAE